MAGKGRLTVSVSNYGDIKSTHKYNVTVKFEIGFDYGGYNSSKRPYSITCNGSTQSGSNSFSVSSGNGSFKYATMGTKTFTVAMDKSGVAKTISISATCSTGVTPSTISASTSKTLSAITWEYKITYDANGGTGAPASQTKNHGTTLTLSSTKPTRASIVQDDVTIHYTFKGWATSASATTATYTAGGSYTTNSAATLYAVWDVTTEVMSIDKPSALLLSTTQNFAKIQLIPPAEFSDNATFDRWEISTNCGTYNLYKNTLIVKWTGNNNVIAYIRVVDTRGIKSSIVEVICNVRLSGFCIYRQGKWRKVSPYIYKNGEYKRLNGMIYKENNNEWVKHICRGREITYLLDESNNYLTDESNINLLL